MAHVGYGVGVRLRVMSKNTAWSTMQKGTLDNEGSRGSRAYPHGNGGFCHGNAFNVTVVAGHKNTDTARCS